MWKAIYVYYRSVSFHLVQTDLFKFRLDTCLTFTENAFNTAFTVCSFVLNILNDVNHFSQYKNLHLLSYWHSIFLSFFNWVSYQLKNTFFQTEFLMRFCRNSNVNNKLIHSLQWNYTRVPLSDSLRSGLSFLFFGVLVLIMKPPLLSSSKTVLYDLVHKSIVFLKNQRVVFQF